VPYKPGELKAVAYRGGKAVVETVQRTAGVPSRLHLTTDNATLKASRSDLALVSLAVRDEHGTLVPSADSHIGVALLGPARFLGCENGDPVDITPQHEPWRKAFGGLARAFYAGLDEKNGSVEVAALSVLGDSRFNGNATVTLACERVALRGPLSSLPFEIHYTLDGTEPALSSPRYTTPFSLQKTTTVRAALFCEGKLLTTSFASFTKGQVQGSELRALVTPGKDQGEAEDPSHEKRKKLSSGPATN
jgi:beta-galactosidase